MKPRHPYRGARFAAAASVLWLFIALSALLGLAHSPPPVPALRRSHLDAPPPAISSPHAATSGHLDLLSTALVACTDGSLHGVDRASGSVRWSLGCGSSWPDTSSGATGEHEECLPFRPVVRASYGPDHLPLVQMLAQSSHSEHSIYLVEPTAQGALYVLSGSPSALLAHASASANPAAAPNGDSVPATLVKLPLTLPQLVSLSPFTFPGDDSRVFVGSKQARLVEVNVRTGAIRSIFGDSASLANVSEATEWDWTDAGAPAEAYEDDVWALIGRTDYTLAIHAKHDPSLSQTLHLSLYSPNLADRDVLATWNARSYPDSRRILVLPDEGSLICLNTSLVNPHAGVSEGADSGEWDEDEDAKPSHQTIWTTAMGASVASVFDFVQSGGGHEGQGSSATSRRPVLVPHPVLRLGDLFHTPEHGGLGQSDEDLDFGVDTYVGASEGSLYAMSSVRYPLAALGPPAPASHSSECHGLQCMIGSYQSQSPPGRLGSIDPFLPFWFDPPLGIDGPASGPWDASRIPTLEPPSSSRPPTPETNSSLNRRMQQWSHPTSWEMAATLVLLTATLTLLAPYLRYWLKPSAPTPPLASQNGKPTTTTGTGKPSGENAPVMPSLAGTTQAAETTSTKQADASGARTPAVLSPQAPNPSTSKAERVTTPSVAIPAPAQPATPEWLADWEVNAQQFRAGVAASTAVPDPAGGGFVSSVVLSGEQPGPATTPPKVKKKRRGKRAGQQVAAKAARAERIAAAEAEISTSEAVPDDGYFTLAPSLTGVLSAQPPAGVSPDDPTQQAITDPSGTEVVASDSEDSPSGSPVRRGTPSAQMDAELATDRAPVVHPSSASSSHLTVDVTRVTPPSATGIEGDELALASPRRDAGARMLQEHLFALDGRGGQVLHNAAPAARTSSLVISDEVLGYGSSGTVVFKGSFQGRAVAVKRLLKDFTRIASKEVHLLESADDHPNVVRYYYQEVTDSFLYIALELCQATLADVVENPGPGPYEELGVLLQPKSALEQIAQGLQHLHGLSIVHRDLKPHNILVTAAPPARSSKYVAVANRRPRLKMLLSDFGLSKKLDGVAQSSFSQTVNHPAGTVGWRAPEILRGEVSLESGAESTDVSVELKPPGTAAERGEERRRLTRAVDVFAYGCIAYYVLSNGQHPFGTRFERELNVLRGAHDLSWLSSLGEEGYEARHLILGCICSDPAKRPTAAEVLLHPYFWTPHKRLQFLLQSSDAFDTLERDPPASALLALERRATDVLGAPGWTKRVDSLFVADLGKFRSYDLHKVQDLLRAMRNKAHHYQDMSPRLQHVLGTLPDGFLMYFTHRFPKLFLHVYNVISSQPFLRSQSRFRIFLEGGPNEV